MATDEELLEVQATAAWRPRSADGSIQAHPAWHDLSPDGRRRAYETTLLLRRIEAALAEDGLTTTGRAVLAAIRRA